MRATTPLTRAIRHLLAGAAFVAQVVLVAAPLVDIHPPATPSAALALHGATGTAWTALPGNDAPQHDASRCPACIAQSIHAAPIAGAVTPIRDLEHRIATETGAALGTTVRTPTAHHSRAPPRLT